MSISNKNSDRLQDIRDSARELLEEAAEQVLDGEYEEAYDILSTEMEEPVTSVRRESYRDERVVANKLEKEVIEDLNSVVTREMYPEKSLEDTKRDLKDYLSGRDWES